MIRNLVDNAVRYTPRGGWVRVRISEEQGAVCIQVADNGPGIPESSHSDAFARFRRLDQSGMSGSGLGLSIVARVVELHGARLQIDSSSAGGCNIQVCFPVETQPQCG